MLEPNLEHIHTVSFQWHPQKVLFRNVGTSTQNETNSREGLKLKWDTTLDSSPGGFPFDPAPAIVWSPQTMATELVWVNALDKCVNVIFWGQQNVSSL